MRLRRLIVLLAAAADPAGACITPLGVPCHTIRFTQTHWQLFRDGPVDITERQESVVTALRRDGSRTTMVDSRYGHLLSSSPDTRKFASMYLAPEDQVVTVDHMARTTARREPLIWHDRPFRYSRPGDSTCSTGALHAGTGLKNQGTDTVAGLPVVKWHRDLGNGGYEDIYLAPSLDCVALRTDRVHRNGWRIPMFIDHMTATSVQYGEPAVEPFAIPAGYRTIPDRARERLLQLRRMR